MFSNISHMAICKVCSLRGGLGGGLSTISLSFRLTSVCQYLILCYVHGEFLLYLPDAELTSLTWIKSLERNYTHSWQDIETKGLIWLPLLGPGWSMLADLPSCQCTTCPSLAGNPLPASQHTRANPSPHSPTEKTERALLMAYSGISPRDSIEAHKGYLFSSFAVHSSILLFLKTLCERVPSLFKCQSPHIIISMIACLSTEWLRWWMRQSSYGGSDVV